MFGYDLRLSKYEDMFYDWKDNDVMVLKKVPMYRVSYEDFMKILCYHGKICNDLYKEINNFDNYVLLSDTKNNIVIKVDNNREIIYIGLLDIKKELDILEISYNFNLIRNVFIKGKKRDNSRENKVKSLMLRELEDLIQNNSLDKMGYLLYEWTSKECNNGEGIKKLLTDKVRGMVDEDYYRIYEIVKLSYSKV